MSLDVYLQSTACVDNPDATGSKAGAQCFRERRRSGETIHHLRQPFTIKA